MDASPVPLADGDVTAPGSIVGLGWFCAKDLQASDRVEFDPTEVDSYGLPAMRIHYTLTAADHATIDAARAAVVKLAGALGEPLNDDPPLTFTPGASLHYQGTVRMGQVDDGTSVCSPTSQVWDAAGLYVAGNGVIPTATACNPTLTSVALAVAGARQIAASLNHQRRLTCSCSTETSSKAGVSATSSTATGSPDSSSSCATPTTGARRPACSTASTSPSTGSRSPITVPLWTLQGRTFTLDELRASTDAGGSSTKPATITVPKPGGLSVGVHDIDVVVYLRRPYFPPMVSRSAFPAQAKRVIVPPVPEGGLRYAVSTYSHSGDLYTSMTLEDVLADTADIGATGIEILGEGKRSRLPDAESGLGRQLARIARDLRAHRHQLRRLGGHRDVARSRPDRRGGGSAAPARPAAGPSSASPRSGRSSVSPRSSWTRTPSGPAPCERSLDLAAELDVLICPEIHSPTPIKHPVTQGYLEFIERTGTDHFKLLIDTGIFQTAPVDDGHEGVEIEEGKKRPAFLDHWRCRSATWSRSCRTCISSRPNSLRSTTSWAICTCRGLHHGALEEADWNGWLSSEYEGRREPYRGRDQVRRQHALLRSLQTRP